MLAAMALPALLLLLAGTTAAVRDVERQAKGVRAVDAASKVLALTGTDYCCCKNSACNAKHEKGGTHFNIPAASSASGKSKCCKVTSSNIFRFRCPVTGYTEVADNSACQPPQNCLPGSFFQKNLCMCDTGTAGIVDYDWPQNSWTTPRCTPTKCPKNAEGEPTCRCIEGYIGKLEWQFGDGTWKSGAWAGECKPTKCPDFAERVPHKNLCQCKSGFTGTLQWVGGGESTYSGACVRVVCPENTHFERDRCKCDDGWIGTGFDYLGGGTGPANCKKVNCPAQSRGHPRCVCDEELEGRVTWVYDNWDSTCRNLTHNCPENSHPNGQGDCMCNTGFAGTLTVESDIARLFGEYEGSCEKVDCPAGAYGHPNCQCIEGRSVALSWGDAQQLWVGDCPGG